MHPPGCKRTIQETLGVINMKYLFTFFFLAISLTIFGQEKLYGEYWTYHLVHGHKLEIKPQNKFILRYWANVINPPEWTGKWETIGDTLKLHFDSDTMGTYTHVIEDEFLIRTNLKETTITDSLITLETPRYLYKKLGKFQDGSIYCQTNWKSVKSYNWEATRVGDWKFYYPNGGLKRIEKYRKGIRHGETEYYSQYGLIVKIEKWKKGELIKTKKYP